MALTTDILAYYKLDWNSNDSVGSNNGTDTSISYGSSYGKINEGALLSGTSRSLITSQSSFNLQSSFTLLAWVKLSSYGKSSSYFGGIITKDNVISGNRCFVFGVRGPADTPNTGKLRFTPNLSVDSSSVLSTSKIPLNQWVLVGIVSTQGTYTFYINGSAAGSASVNITPSFQGTAPLCLGLQDNTPYVESMLGSIDEVGVWSRALSSTEITELYNSWDWLQYPFTSTAIQKIYLWTTQLQSFKLGSTDIQKIYLWSTEVFSK